MGKIHELPKSSSRLLTSAQIISSVYSVVKELIENSLDSSSKNVEVKLEDYGLEKIEVKDNGCGIDQYDLQFVAKPHCTSKIDSYSDLNKVETYGFRGEALSAICAVADLVITTKSEMENFGSIVNFGPDGQAISCKPCPCAQGTTVAVLNLFKNVPVRRQYYRSDKNKKEALCKIEDLLISYGCIQTDVRFALYHNKNLIWQKPALTSTKNSLIHIFGNSVLDNLKYAEHIDEQNQRKIEAYLPKLGAPLTCGISSSAKCITAINKRPVRIKAIDKLLKDYYNKAIQNSGRARYPICYVSFTTLLTEVDVNVEPNKTIVMLHHSEEILEQFSEMLKSFYSCNSSKDINVLPLQNTLPASEPKSNTSEFLNSLKAKSDIKLQQSKLNIVNGSVSPFESKSSKECNANNSDSLNKKDIIEVGGLKEPCKKKLKTSSSKKDIENHISTLSNFFAVETQNGFNKTPNLSTNFDHHVSSVTVERVCSNPRNEHSLKINNNVISNQLEKTASLTVSSNLVPNNSAIDINNIPNNNKMEKNSTFGLTSNVLQNNHSKDNDDFDNNQQRITTFGITSNIFSNNHSKGNNNVLNSDQQERITTFDVKSSMFPNKSAQNNTNASNNVNEKHLADSSVQVLQMKNGLVQNPLTDNNIQKDEKWSRGVQPSGEQMQPVAVLQPKVLPSKGSLKKKNDQNFDENVPLDDVVENNYKKIEKDHSNSKKSFEKKHPNPEEKLAPFDMFCRSHRLEADKHEHLLKKDDVLFSIMHPFCSVAAENPNYNTQQIAQILFEKWKGLSAEERAVYKNMLVYKDFKQDVKKKERLGKIISQNLSEDVKNKTSFKAVTAKLKPEGKTKDVPCSIEKIKSYYLTKNRSKSMHEDLNVINYLAPGIWVCVQREKLYLLNTFRLQETIVYHRLLDTYEFDTEPLDIPEPLSASNLGEDAVLILMQLSNSSIGSSGTINDERLTANGFVIKFTIGERSEISFELIRIASCIAFYGVPDLKELLLLIKEKGISSKLSLCRPSKIDLFLQSEANRMSRSSPACQRRQDVEDLLNQRSKLPANCNSCIHHKPFFSEIWKL